MECYWRARVVLRLNQDFLHALQLEARDIKAVGKTAVKYLDAATPVQDGQNFKVTVTPTGTTFYRLKQ